MSTKGEICFSNGWKGKNRAGRRFTCLCQHQRLPHDRWIGIGADRFFEEADQYETFYCACAPLSKIPAFDLAMFFINKNASSHTTARLMHLKNYEESKMSSAIIFNFRPLKMAALASNLQVASFVVNKATLNSHIKLIKY